MFEEACNIFFMTSHALLRNTQVAPEFYKFMQLFRLFIAIVSFSLTLPLSSNAPDVCRDRS